MIPSKVHRIYLNSIAKYSGIFTLVVIATIIGSAIWGSWFQPRSSFSANTPMPLFADAAVKGKTMSMATGLVVAEVEGLYVLDHASGLLQCWILNPRTGAVGGIFQTNILQDLPTEKVGGGDYVMCTGTYLFTGGTTGNLVPSASVVYVGDEATGNVVGYSFNFNRTELNRGAMQNGVLRAICAGPTRGEGTVRDQ